MSSEAQQLIDYILREVIRNPEVSIDENTPLVSSGLIDSMKLVDILLELETIVNMRIPAGKVRAKDMDTVALAMATAERVGKPRKR
jgi:acyl carrier protein